MLTVVSWILLIPFGFLSFCLWCGLFMPSVKIPKDGLGGFWFILLFSTIITALTAGYIWINRF